MRRSRLAALATFALLGTATAQADDDFWLGLKAGTLGLGVEATWRPLPLLDLRGGVNAFSFDRDGEEAGIDYQGEADLRTFYATLNLRAPATPFRLTAGLFHNGNELSLRSEDASSYEIGGQVFPASQVGTLHGLVDFDSTAPYAGVGMDFRLMDTLGLNFDAGVLWQGSPRVDLDADGPAAGDPQFQAALEAERAELEDDVDDFDLYPVVSLGLSWNF